MGNNNEIEFIPFTFNKVMKLCSYHSLILSLIERAGFMTDNLTIIKCKKIIITLLRIYINSSMLPHTDRYVNK